MVWSDVKLLKSAFFAAPHVQSDMQMLKGDDVNGQVGIEIGIDVLSTPISIQTDSHKLLLNVSSWLINYHGFVLLTENCGEAGTLC